MGPNSWSIFTRFYACFITIYPDHTFLFSLPVVSCSHGSNMAAWQHCSTAAAWQHSSTAARQRGSTAARQHGSTAVVPRVGVSRFPGNCGQCTGNSLSMCC